MKAKHLTLLLVWALLLFGCSTLASADSGEELDITITVVGEEDEPEQMVEQIVLPIQKSAAAVAGDKGKGSKAAGGSDMTEPASEKKREFVHSTAEEARAKGGKAKNNAQGIASQAASQAREKIKDIVGGNPSENAKDKIPDDVKDAIGKSKDKAKDKGKGKGKGKGLD